MVKTQKRCRAVLLVLLPVLLLCCAVWAALPMRAEAAAQTETAVRDTTPTTKDSFLIGSWENYYPHANPYWDGENRAIRSYEEQTANLADLGFNFANFPYRWTDYSTFFAPGEEQEYWEAQGVVWDDSFDGQTFWNYVDEVYRQNNMVYLMYSQRLLRNHTEEEQEQILVDWARDLTNCIGYHVFDEPDPSQFDYWASVVNRYRQLDPERIPFMNMLPYVPIFNMTYREFLTKWVESVKKNAGSAEQMGYLSHDVYPILQGGNRTDFYGMLEDMRYVAYENGKLRTHALPQACQWNGTRMPNADEIRWNVYSYVAYGFKALSYFNVVTPCGNDFLSPEDYAFLNRENYQTAIIHWDGTIPDMNLYNSFKELNWEIRAMGDILMNLDTAHAYHTQRGLSGVEFLPNDYPIKPKGNEDLVISEMLAKDETESHIMILNKSTSQSLTPTLKIYSSDIEGLQWFNTATKAYENVEITNGEFSVALRPGEGKLFRVLGSLSGEKVSQAPRIKLASGEYDGSISVSMEFPAGITAENGAQIRYTLDGTAPTASSLLYNGPIVFATKSDSVQKYYLRAAVVQSGKVGEAASRVYLLKDYDGYNVNLYNAQEENFEGTGGVWSHTGGICELTSRSDTGEACYTYKTALGKSFITESIIDVSNSRGGAGFGFKDALEAPDRAVDIFVYPDGGVNITANGNVIASSKIQISDTANIKLKVFRYFEDITVYINGQEVLSAYVNGSDNEDWYVSVASDGALFSAASWRARSFTPDCVAVKRNIVSVKKISPIAIDLYVTKQDVLELLPQKVTCTLEEGASYEVDVVWDCSAYDRTLSGRQIFYGNILLATDSDILNSSKLQAEIAVDVRYNLDLWELQQLVNEVESLNENDFTADTWSAVAMDYEAAKMLIVERNDAQQGVIPIIWRLEKAISELVNPSINWKQLNNVLNMCEQKDAQLYTEQSYAAFYKVYTEVKNMSQTGPYGKDEAKNRVSRLNAAMKCLVERGEIDELQNKIAEARAISSDSYSQSSYARLAAAIEAAEKLTESPENVTAEEAEYAAKAIDSAKAALCAPAEISGGKSGCGSQATASMPFAAAAILGMGIVLVAVMRKRTANKA